MNCFVGGCDLCFDFGLRLLCVYLVCDDVSLA